MKLKDILKQSLNIGAIKTDDFVHNGGWYNGKGEYLGWGDLSKEDLHNVAANIPEGEQLFVLKERDRLGQLNVDYHYLLEKCVVVVVKDGVFWVTNNAQTCSHVDQEQRIPYVDRKMLMFLFGG